MIIISVFKGFIDPRRGDTLKIIFNVKDEDVKLIGKGHDKGFKYIFSDSLKKMEDDLRLKFKYFSGRESWYEVDGEKFNRFSGSGPCPDYPCPKGDIVNLTINMK